MPCFLEPPRHCISRFRGFLPPNVWSIRGFVGRTAPGLSPVSGEGWLSSSGRGKACGGMTPLADTGVVLPLRTLRAASEERKFCSRRNSKQSVGFIGNRFLLPSYGQRLTMDAFFKAWNCPREIFFRTLVYECVRNYQCDMYDGMI